MKGFKELSAVALSLLAATVFAEDAAAEDKASDVKVLTTESFEPFLKENPLVLAEFYAPWCGHCKALAPEYEDAATKLKEKNIPLAKVDCTVETSLCEDQGVQGYPTLKVFRGVENSSQYSGQRKSDAIVSYMNKQSLPAVSELTKENLEEFSKSDKVVLVAYVDAEDKENLAVFTQVAESLRDSYLFGSTTDAELAKKAGVTAPAVVLYKTFDEGKDIFQDKFKVDALKEFASVAATPLIGEVGPDTYAGYMESGLPLAYIFVDSEDDKTKLSDIVRPIAEKLKGKVNFATLDATLFGAHAGNLNLEQKWPAFAIQETTKQAKYPFDQTKDLTAEGLKEFVEDFVAGKLEPSIKSEPIPEKQEGPVHVVVANNYDEIVNDDEKDVLVEYYAPWCGHCKNLAPKYEELGGLYFKNPEFAKKVVIAKVDATANDVPVDIQGFPTIKLFPAGKKDSPVDYAGSRTVEDLAAFVRDNGAHKVDAYTVAEDKETSKAPAEPAAEEPAAAAPAASEVEEETKEETKDTKEEKKDEHDEL